MLYEGWEENISLRSMFEGDEFPRIFLLLPFYVRSPFRAILTTLKLLGTAVCEYQNQSYPLETSRDTDDVLLSILSRRENPIRQEHIYEETFEKGRFVVPSLDMLCHMRYRGLRSFSNGFNLRKLFAAAQTVNVPKSIYSLLRFRNVTGSNDVHLTSQ